MKKLKTPFILLVFVAILAIIKITFLSSPKNDLPPAQGKGGTVPANPVNAYVVTAHDINSDVFVTGSVIANEEVILMPEISGKLVSLLIKEGTQVHKGDLLAKINDADLQAQLKKLVQQLKIIEDKVTREKQLLAINGISQEEFDTIQSQYESLKADIDYTKAQIEKTEIRAPFNGVVGLKSVSEGSFINPATRIAAIQQLNPVKIDFSIPEKYTNSLGKNDIIHFTISENKENFSAKVYAIEPKIDPNTRTIQLRALAENDNGKIFPGAFAKVHLPLKKIENALMIPTEAIMPVLKGKQVFLCKNGKALQIPVETGIRTDSLIQITSGIQSGDTVIITGIMQLKSGSPVRIVPANK